MTDTSGRIDKTLCINLEISLFVVFLVPIVIKRSVGFVKFQSRRTN